MYSYKHQNFLLYKCKKIEMFVFSQLRVKETLEK